MDLYTIVLYGLVSWWLGFTMGIGLVYYQLVQYSKKLVKVPANRTNVKDLFPPDRGA